MKKAVLCEFGDSHDDIFYAQFEFLKKSGFETFFIGNRIFEQRIKEYDNLEKAFFLDFGQGQIQNFNQIRKTWKLIRKYNINYIILNTIDGTPVRNFCLFPFHNRVVTGIIHNAGSLYNGSFTFDYLIKPKIKRMFALNSYIWQNNSLPQNLKTEWVYPIAYPHFNPKLSKKNNEFHIVVPGLVESSRRDYYSLVNSLTGFNLPENIKIILLGKSMHAKGIGKELKEMAAGSKLDKNFVFFDDFVDWDTFRSYINSADLIAPLLHPEHGNFGNYTSTKITGSYLLAFAHKIPLLSHIYFNQGGDIGNSSIFYDTDMLADVILKCYTDRSLILNVRRKMLENSNFDFEFNRRKYVDFIIQ